MKNVHTVSEAPSTNNILPNGEKPGQPFGHCWGLAHVSSDVMGHKMDDATSDPYEKEVIVNDEWGRQLYNLPRFAKI